MNDSTPYRKLYRSRTDRKIAGICGGLAAYYQIDPVWIRLIFVIFFLAGGSAFLVYVIMWLIVPLEPMSQDRFLDQQNRQF